MTDAQSLVLSMLGLILLIDVSFSQDSRNFFKTWGTILGNPNAALANHDAVRKQLSGQVSLTVFWLIGAAMLLGLAFYWPRIAIGVAGLLLLTVVFARSDPIILWTKDLTGWLTAHNAAATAQNTATGALQGVQSGGTTTGG